MSRQGVVQEFYRTRNRDHCGPYFRIVFRQNGHQRTFYLGTDGDLVELARAELERLQRPRKEDLDRRQRLRDYVAVLRETRRQIRALLKERDLQLKGWELRGVRAARHVLRETE